MTTNILVAGKSAANVRLVKEAFHGQDYQVIPAPSMSLALFLSRKNLPALILCDLEMIDGDPHQFLHELRADDELCRVPFMVMAHTPLSDEERKKFMSTGTALVLNGAEEISDMLSIIEPYIAARLASKEERPEETTE